MVAIWGPKIPLSFLDCSKLQLYLHLMHKLWQSMCEAYVIGEHHMKTFQRKNPFEEIMHIETCLLMLFRVFFISCLKKCSNVIQ